LEKKNSKNIAQIHFHNERCPYCNMKTKNLNIHLAYYHLGYRRKAILLRDLAILCKEANTTDILKDENLKLDNYIKFHIKRMMKKL